MDNQQKTDIRSRKDRQKTDKRPTVNRQKIEKNNKNQQKISELFFSKHYIMFSGYMYLFVVQDLDVYATLHVVLVDKPVNRNNVQIILLSRMPYIKS